MEHARETARTIARRLRGAGHQALFAGGCVRDGLLGRVPKDYDIATSARPEEVLGLFPRAKQVGAHFGVVLVKLDGEVVEVATFRRDGPYLDGRHPASVSFTDAEEDAKRRDFTVNGLFEDPESGEILDYVGGRADLEARRLRAIGEPAERFGEDALRLLRAVRFATVLGFEIEAATWRAIRENAGRLDRISPERIRDEFSRLILAPRRATGLDLLLGSGLLARFLPEAIEMVGCEQPPEWHPEGDVFTHTRIMLDMLGDSPSLPLCLAVLLHDIGKPPTRTWDEQAGRIRFNGHDRAGAEMAETILSRLRYPNAIIEQVREMIARHMQFMHVQEMRTAKLKRFMARPTFDEELELHRVDCASSNGFTDNYEFLLAKRAEFAAEPIIPPPLATGRDLIALGLNPGPRFKEILDAVQVEQLEGRLETRAQALEWLREFARP
jgi:poly(A) polymerase